MSENVVQGPPTGDETGGAEERIRSVVNDCVHCGFCLPACPTYSLWGEEMDSPRGRIYLVSQLLDGAPLTPAAGEHFDRCLGCMACVTACPSGVQYGQIIEAAREWTEAAGGHPVPRVELVPNRPHQGQARHRAVHPAVPGKFRPHRGGSGQDDDRAPFAGHRPAQRGDELGDRPGPLAGTGDGLVAGAQAGLTVRADPYVEDAGAG